MIPANYSSISFPTFGIEVNPPRILELGPLTIHYYGAIIALGAFMPLMGFLINLTFFHASNFALWSLYPMTALVFLGCLLIFIAICKPAREWLERKFFI